MIRPLLACWFLVFACGSAAAEERPVLPIETVPAPSVAPESAPVVMIVKPANLAVVDTHAVAKPSEKWGRLDCLLDPADREIRIEAKNWKLSPKGNGITVVVDGAYSTTVHDLSKPIRMDAFVPYTGAWPAVLSVCGWHSIVAFATDAGGLSVSTPSAVAVSHYFAAMENPRASGHAPQDKDLEYYGNLPILVFNPAPWNGQYVKDGMGDGNAPARKLAGGPVIFDLVYGTPKAGAAPSDCAVQVDTRGPDGYEMGVHPDLTGWASPMGRFRTAPIDAKAQKDGRLQVQARVRCQQPSFVNVGAPLIQIRFAQSTPILGDGPWPVFSGKNKPRDDFFKANKKAIGKQIHRARVRNGDEPPDAR